MKTLIASTNSLHGPKKHKTNRTEICRCKRAFKTYFRNPRGKAPTYPHPLPPLGVPFSMKLKHVKTVRTQTMSVQWLLSSTCKDCCNLFLIKLMLFQSVFLVSATSSLRKWAWLYLLLFCLFPDIDECASGTDDCHSSRASCTNTEGSFNCSCNSSYVGDGRTCNIISGN